MFWSGHVYVNKALWGNEEKMGELDFSGKKVLVVGGSSGIGNGIAHGFRDHGAEVLSGGRGQRRL